MRPARDIAEMGAMAGEARPVPYRQFDYLRNPEEIYQASFEAVEAAADFSSLPANIAAIARRMVHACALPEIVPDIAFHPALPVRARRALRAGAPILCDAHMVAMGLDRKKLPAGCEIICTLDAAKCGVRAHEHGITRSAASVDFWEPRLDGAIVVIGNAPTALFRLLEGLLAGALPRPAAIFALPVGFIGAEEAKAALLAAPLDIAFITLRGRLGGSAIAAAAINALIGELQNEGHKKSEMHKG